MLTIIGKIKAISLITLVSSLVSSETAIADCSSNDWSIWNADNNHTSFREKLMPMLACREDTGAIWDSAPCNQFVGKALEHLFGYKDFTSPTGWLLANQIYEYVHSNPQIWKRLGNAGDQRALQEAAAGADNGHAVIAIEKAEPHGHIALILPGKVAASGSWSLSVPASASFLLNKPEKSYVGCRLSYAWTAEKVNQVELWFRVK